MVLKRGALLVLVGIIVGLAGAVASVRIITSLLIGVEPTDVATFAGTTILVALVALLASLVPALRALKVEPTTALRYE